MKKAAIITLLSVLCIGLSGCGMEYSSYAWDSSDDWTHHSYHSSHHPYYRGGDHYSHHSSHGSHGGGGGHDSHHSSHGGGGNHDSRHSSRLATRTKPLDDNSDHHSHHDSKDKKPIDTNKHITTFKSPLS